MRVYRGKVTEANQGFPTGTSGRSAIHSGDAEPTVESVGKSPLTGAGLARILHDFLPASTSGVSPLAVPPFGFVAV